MDERDFEDRFKRIENYYIYKQGILAFLTTKS